MGETYYTEEKYNEEGQIVYSEVRTESSITKTSYEYDENGYISGTTLETNDNNVQNFTTDETKENDLMTTRLCHGV